MRQKAVTKTTAGNSNWVFLDTRWAGPELSLSVTVSPDIAGLGYDVQYTLDRNTKSRWQDISISSDTDTVTVTLVDHGLKAGDSIVVFNTGNSSLDGTFDVATAADDDTLTYTVTGIGTTTAAGKLIAFRTVDLSFTGTGAETGNVTVPVSAIRLNVDTITDGSVTLTALQQG